MAEPDGPKTADSDGPMAINSALDTSWLEESVLRRLEELCQQMDTVAQGQSRVEDTVKDLFKRAYPDANLPASGYTQSTHLHHIKRKFSTDLKVTPRGSSAEGDRGFWPRKEWQTMHYRPASTVIKKSLQLKVRRLSSFDEERADYLPVHPDSWRRAFFDFISMLVLFYDSLLIPYQLAWPQPFQGWLAAVSWSTFAFWCVDLVLGFFTGYHGKEGVVMDLGLIWRRYLRSAFIPNLLVLIADCLGNVEVFSSDQNDNLTTDFIKLMRFIKLQRIVRLASSFRTGKVAEARDWLATKMRQRGVDEKFQITARICKLMFYIMWVNHLGGCLWQIIGQDAIRNWYADNGIAREHGQEDEKTESMYEYALGFYFSATAMIAGGSIMVPSNTSEMVVTVFFIVLGFILSSVIISSLLATVMEYQDANRERVHKLDNLRQFLYQNGIDAKIAVPIVNQVHERMWQKRRLAEGDVEALSLISPIMRSELWYHIYQPHISALPFLCTCNSVKRGLIKDICFRALRHSSHRPGTLVFEPGTEAVGAHYVCQGSFDYVCSHVYTTTSDGDDVQANKSYSGPDHLKAIAEEGTWISEMALWVHWQHRGWLDARTPCETMTVESDKFIEVLCGMQDLGPVIQAYTKCFVEALADLRELTDLQSPPHHSIVAAMPLETRTVLSKAALDVLQKRASGRIFQSYSGLEELKEEIQAGACDLVLQSDEVQRLVTVVALRLARSDGTILVRIGKCTKGVIDPSCELPGTKVKVGEYPKTAVERILREKLGAFEEGVRLGTQFMDVQTRVSKTYGLKSKYMRVVFEADMEGEDDDELEGCVQLPSKTSSQERSASFACKSSQLSQRLSRIASGLRGLPMDFCHEGGQAFVFRTDVDTSAETMIIFAWLRPEDFGFLGSPAGEERLQQWLADLDLDGVGQAASRLNSQAVDRVNTDADGLNSWPTRVSV